MITDDVYKEMWEELKAKTNITDIDKDTFYFSGLAYLFIPSYEDEMLADHSYSDLWNNFKSVAIDYSEDCMRDESGGTDALNDVIDCMYEIEDQRGLFQRMPGPCR